MTNAYQQLKEQGYAVLPGIFAFAETSALAGQVEETLMRDRQGSALKTADDTLYAARNLLELWPAVKDVWRRPPLPAVLDNILGPQFGLVRALYFDKPPERTWALPWHKDLTIAVRDNRLPSQHFQKPTTKAGVPHVRAPQGLLENMLTLRIHLDEVTDENGPLLVIPGSHQTDLPTRPRTLAPVKILVLSGDVLLMRPMLDHRSPCSHTGTTRHRRLLHLEFSGWPTLPDGYAWHDFIAGH